LRMRFQPSVGQDLTKAIRRIARQPLQDVFQVRERINLVSLAARHQAIQRCRRPAASVTSNEHVGLSTDRLRAEAPLRDVVIDAQLAVEGVRLGKRTALSAYSAVRLSPRGAAGRLSAS
jgi:hypothetical protein